MGQEQGKNGSEQSIDLEQRFKKMRELYADATPVSKAALENVIRALPAPINTHRKEHGHE